MSETIETGTRRRRAADSPRSARMPNTRPVNDNASVTRSIVERAAAVGAVRVWPIGAASVGSKGEALAEICRDEAGRNRRRLRRRQAHRHRETVAAGDGVLPRARSCR